MHLSSGITLAAAVAAQAISLPLATRDPQPESRVSMWKPAVGTTWQIVLRHPLKINLQSPAVDPGHVDVYDIDLFDNTKNGTDGSTIAALHSLGKKVICYFSAGTYEAWRHDAKEFKAADKGNKMNNWDEIWVNINSPNIRDLMAKRIKIAADMGCDAIDPDNVDGYLEAPVNDQGPSTFHLDKASTASFVKFLSGEAAKYKMSTGLKNAAEVIDDVISDVHFSVNEECAAYKECNMFLKFIKAGKPVFHIEYPAGMEKDADETPLTDLTKWCQKSPDWSGPDVDISKMSTVIKNLQLNGWVQYCDGKTFKTPR
ncbi:hypothetical protein PpBr36_07901 [Pyricularia pennisetigena]|uniref:hypothetical protein n=1 Tax=Pyricularia pennisetigena TaxID=1578925 RepID=UPI001154C277|nr:hypothetical protein PpBr36_07901 [Pyricularia pennisetigena]TLS25797.1 hypothetical protein PpBr36_07901 [Pyricularia pennisetigena]